MLDNCPEPECPGKSDENVFIQREKRRSGRKPIRATFSMTIDAAQIQGVGKDVSETGAYFITAEEIPVEVTIKCDDGEKTVEGKIVRIDRISETAQGVAIHFDTRIMDMKL